MANDKLAFRPELEVQLVPGEGVLLLSDDVCKVLQGDAYEKAVALLDGTRGADEIVAALAGEVAAERVYYVLHEMQAKGYVAAATATMPEHAPAYWDDAGVDPGSTRAARGNARVSVTALDSAPAAPLIDALAAAHLETAAPERSSLWLVTTDDYLHPELAQINRAALAAGRAWLLMRATARESWLGPLFVPGATGCWACLSRRLERNRVAHRYLAGRTGVRVLHQVAAAPPGAHRAASRIAALAVAQYLAGLPGAPVGCVQSLDWTTRASRRHMLVRNPRCAACGTPHDAQPHPIELQHRAATFTRDGGHRGVPPEVTFETYGHHVSPITGVVRALTAVRTDEGVAHVYAAGHNLALPLERLEDLKRCLRHASAGKGMTAQQAKASALGEALERHSGEFAGDEARVRRAFRDFAPGEAIHPNEVMRFSARQFAQRELWNARGSRFNRVPVPLPDDKPVDWTPLWSLTEQRHKYVPTQLLYHRAAASDGDATIHAIGCSNGCAAGNTLEEAILQGFLELVERDAVAIWWYNRVPRPGVDVASFGEPQLATLAQHSRERLGRETWALDLTHDLGIPVFAALSRLADAPHQRILFGFGCHLDPRIALQRAYAELHQMLGMSQPEDAAAMGIDDRETLEWLDTATLAKQPYLVADPDRVPVRHADFPLQHSGDLLDDIDHCRRIVESRGMEVLVLDQTRADIGMPVAKVVVPGLRHLHARFGPGRLYDVPVAMGWLGAPRDESGLNPVWMFL